MQFAEKIEKKEIQKMNNETINYHINVIQNLQSVIKDPIASAGNNMKFIHELLAHHVAELILLLKK